MSSAVAPRPASSATRCSGAVPTDLSSLAEGHESLRYGILSTFPPTACGLATFSAALMAGLAETGAEVGVVRVIDGSEPDADRSSADPAVLGSLVNDRAGSAIEAAELLNDCDVVIVQHEYGLYGGIDGDEVLEVLRRLVVPSIVIVHTVLLGPTDHQRAVLEEVAALATTVVVMTDAARLRLCRRFEVAAGKVTVIPHGAAHAETGTAATVAARPMILTWGLIGPGKGIEWAIDALGALADMRPRPRYVVAGRTHPKVLAHEGDVYRERLVARTWAAGLAPTVTFDPTYRDVASLTRLISSASVVVLPYDSVDQVTSGALVDAVAAGVPVVATAFPHAVELLSGGAGLVVPHRDPIALAAAIRRVLSEPGLAASMSARARRIAPRLGWDAVARRYAAAAHELVGQASVVGT